MLLTWLLVSGLLAFAEGRQENAPLYVPVLKAKQANFLESLEKTATALLGRPYANGPLGEGDFDPVDADPLYRLDRFDCTTYVETVLANTYCRSESPAKVGGCLEKNMRRIRYHDGKISFRSRNHFTELDWLPANVEKGYLENISATVFPGEAKQIKFIINREAWLADTLKKEYKAEGKNDERTVVMDYLPTSLFFRRHEGSALKPPLLPETKPVKAAPPTAKDDLEGGTLDPTIEKFRTDMEQLKQDFEPNEERLRQIPSGTILNLVRGEKLGPEERRKISTRIAHQGIVIQKEDGTYFFHAAPNVGHVTRQKLSDYLLRFLKSDKSRGITLYRIRPNGP